MAPIHIDILIHYYTTPTEYRAGDHFPVRNEVFDELVRDGLLRLRASPSEYGATYETTACAAALIDDWCNTPLPEQVWIIKRP